jgi:hypothetical protein
MQNQYESNPIFSSSLFPDTATHQEPELGAFIFNDRSEVTDSFAYTFTLIVNLF